MISKQNRLTRKEFNQIRKSGHKLFLNSFLIYYQKNSEFKASVVISKKIAKKAVIRNKFRRYIYNHLYKHFLTKNVSLIIYPQKYDENLSSLDQVISKLS